jgi:hypothetical protein
VNPPLTPLRHRIDQSDTFVPTTPVDTLIMEHAKINVSEIEVVTIIDLRAEVFLPTLC